MGVVAPEEDIMTLQDLLLAEQIGRIARIDPDRVAIEDEARRRARGGGVRHAIGRAFVRLGRWLDPADVREPLARVAPDATPATAVRHTW